MNDNDISRPSRLTAILTQLQTKRLLTDPELASKFLRKDYREFRLARIQKIKILNDTFKQHKITLQEYFESCTTCQPFK